MSHSGNERHAREAKRGASSTRRQRRSAKKLRTGQVEQELLTTIRTGVERFILKDSTVEEFMVMIRSLTAKEHLYSHQLTSKVFSKIVKQAIEKRNLKRGT